MAELYQNVNGLERAVSVAAGLFTVARGVHQGGAAGVLKALGGAAILQRGLSGHCVLKGMSCDPAAELQYLRGRVAEMRLLLTKLEAEVARTRSRALPAAEKPAAKP
ncbi:DUF2892 domain-containing protein [Pseudomonas sp. NPDC078700]|uniref:DUF2892 domain-containing protein n=1 Tax=Pseudomonas sp. NPDC078700 TaxID=3364424 RepID=UPI0037C71E88